MAANDVLVYKLDELEKCSGKMGAVADALERVRTMAASVGSGAGEHWQGEAYDAFSKRMNGLLKAVEKMFNEVSSSREKLDKAIALERQNEEALTSGTVGKLSADNIF